jgi:hypothetical protein
MENTPETKTYENPRTAAKMKWYNRVKNDPAYAERFKEQRKRYYEAHKEQEQTKALERYYRRKAQAPGTPETPGA